MNDTPSTCLENSDLVKKARDLIDSENTMTLATAREDVAWAAPVYYVFHDGSFYFFSDPGSRHIRESLTGGQVSAAIHAHASTWKEIRGIQMSGHVKASAPGITALEALRRYLGKFAFTKEFFSPGRDIDLCAFSERFRVKFYRFDPELVFYLDNGIRFGFRERICLKKEKP